jgi:hypothetical protein
VREEWQLMGKLVCLDEADKEVEAFAYRERKGQFHLLRKDAAKLGHWRLDEGKDFYAKKRPDGASELADGRVLRPQRG